MYVNNELFKIVIEELANITLKHPEIVYGKFNRPLYKSILNSSYNTFMFEVIDYYCKDSQSDTFDKELHFPYNNFINKFTYMTNIIFKEYDIDISNISIRSFENYMSSGLYYTDTDLNILNVYIHQYIDQIKSRNSNITFHSNIIAKKMRCMFLSIIFDSVIYKMPNNNLDSVFSNVDYILNNKDNYSKDQFDSVLESLIKKYNTFINISNQLFSYDRIDILKYINEEEEISYLNYILSVFIDVMDSFINRLNDI